MPFATDDILNQIAQRMEVAMRAAREFADRADRTGTAVALARAAELGAFGSDLAWQANRRPTAEEFNEGRRRAEGAIRDLY
jgi:hypothetical protein